MSAGLVSLEASLLGLKMAILSLCPHPFVHVYALMSSYKNTSHIGLKPSLMTSIILNYLFKGPISEQSHSDVLGFRVSTL